MILKTKRVSIAHVRSMSEQQDVCIIGTVSNVRKMKTKTFLDVRDETGSIQVVCNRSIAVTIESCVGILGSVQVIDKDDSILDSVAHDFQQVLSREVLCTHLEIKSLNIHEGFVPFKHNIGSCEGADRHLFLRTVYMQNNLRGVSYIKRIIRNILEGKKFTEISTPYLSIPSAEGSRQLKAQTQATAKTNTHYALAQSPQLYKQTLMSSGFELYYQIARCFRDEDLRTDRQIEFEQLDIEMAFAQIPDIYQLVENIVTCVCNAFKVTITFSHMTFNEALSKYGTDKPDLRLTDTIKRHGDTSYVDLVLPKDVEPVHNTTISRLSTKGLCRISWDKSKEDYVTLTGVGKLISIFGRRDKTEELRAVFIKDWPMLIQQQSGVVASQHPFFRVVGEEISNPYSQSVSAIDLVINGTEIGTGGERETRTHIIKEYLQLVGCTDLSPYNQFFKVLESGVPPHGGFGLGIERLAFIVLRAKQMRDVIAFPKSKTGSCPVLGKPI